MVPLCENGGKFESVVAVAMLGSSLVLCCVPSKSFVEKKTFVAYTYKNATGVRFLVQKKKYCLLRLPRQGL
eukprot:1753906-Amphidinium_carterae.1